MLAHQLRHGSQQLVTIDRGQLDDKRVELVVVMVFVVVVMAGALVDGFLCRLRQTQQHIERQATVVRLHHLHFGRQFFAHHRLHLGKFFGAHAIDLVEHHQIGSAQLVFEQLVQRALVIEVGIGAALLVHGVGERGKLARSGRGGVHHGDHGVHGEHACNLGPLEGLHQWFGQGEARGFDEDRVDLIAARGQLLHHGEELFLHRAAHAAVGEFVQRALDGRAAFVTADAAGLQDVAIDAQLAKLVDDDGDAATIGVVQNVAQQGGLAAAEKAGDDGGGNFGGVHEADDSR